MLNDVYFFKLINVINAKRCLFEFVSDYKWVRGNRPVYRSKELVNII